MCNTIHAITNVSGLSNFDFIPFVTVNTMAESMLDPMEICSENQLKRALTHDGNHLEHASPKHSLEHPEAFPTPPLTASPVHQQSSDRQPSPAPSSSALSSVAPSSTERPPGSSAPPPKKRRKLTVTEKQEQLEAKEIKDREKAEQKAKKDEEKRTKDEEKRRKNEEKEAKQREKDMKKAEEEKEKEKKEKVSMIILYKPTCAEHAIVPTEAQFLLRPSEGVEHTLSSSFSSQHQQERTSARRICRCRYGPATKINTTKE